MLTLEQVKEFMKIETSDEDAFLSSLISVSKTFIVNATHPNADETTELFMLAQRFIILHWYENREIIGSSNGMNYHFEAILQQIRYTTEDVV
jgi:uncharacterized phage protein (predicted DNA packaging)